VRSTGGPPGPGGTGTTPRVVLLPLVLMAALVLTQLGERPSASAAPGQDPSGAVQIEAVTPWVAADGTFSVEIRVPGSIPDDAELTWTVRQRIRPVDGDLRSPTEQFLAGEGQLRTLQAPRSTAVGSLEVVPEETATVPGELRRLGFDIRSGSGDADSILVPTAGIHPVTLEITVGDDVIWNATTYLNRLPAGLPQAEDGSVAHTAVQLLAGLDSGPTLGVDGTAEIPTDEIPTVSSIQSLLGESLEIPLTVALRPNTLLGLQRSAVPADRAFVASLAGAQWSFAPQTYVRVDAAALTEAPGDELARQLTAGTTINNALSGREPSPLWILDDTVDQAAAGFLASAGIGHVVTSAERLDVRADGDSLSDDEAQALLRSTSVRLEGSPGLSVSTYDAELTRVLVEPGIEPALRAHRVVTELMAEWFTAAVDAGSEGTFRPLTASVVLTPGVGSEVVAELAGMLSGDGPLRVAAPPPADRDSDSAVARLRYLQPADATSVVRRTQRMADRIQGWRSMTGPTDTLAGELDLVNDQAPSRFADDSTRNRIWDDVDAALEDKVSQIGVPADRTIVLTSRSGSIPLRFRNDTGEQIRLAMRTRSPRLEFPDGPVTEIVLVPGDNRVDLPVEVQAPGSSVLRMELSSPDRRLDIPDASVTVRSSSISGVGAALSVLSILVLAAWWIRTHRARRDVAKDEPRAEPATADGTDGTTTIPQRPEDGGTGV